MRSMFRSSSPEKPRHRSRSRNRRREQTLARSMQMASEQQQQQQDDEISTMSSRRRNMGFMKYASEQKRSSISMDRTREHAKQIAMALSSSSSPTFADFGSAFGSGEDPFADLVAPKKNSFPDDAIFSFTESASRSNVDDFFQVDPFSPDALAKHHQQQHIRSSRRSRAMDIVSDPGAAATDWPVVRVSAATASPKTKRAPTMSTMPSNSSMQSSNFAKFHDSNSSRRRQPATSSVEAPMTPEAQQLHSSNSIQSLSQAPLSTDAAARRRFRTQMRKVAGRDESSSTSPYSMKRTDSVGSGRSNTVGKATNHLANYTSSIQQNRSVPPSAAQITASYHHAPTTSIESSSASSEPNLFDSKARIGFSFDAFGLDSSAMNREVTEAMNDLAGSHPSISMFFQDPTDDFAAGRWDTATTSSANDNGTVSNSSREDNGFVDGFRVTKAAAGLPVQHVRESPTRSERSSLTSESLDHNNNNNPASVNMFKQQAGFHTSKPRKVVRPALESQQDVLPQRKQLGKGQVNVVGMNGFKTHALKREQSQQLPHMPNLEGNYVKVSSPRKQQPEAVEFYGEDSSSDEERYGKAPNYSSSGGRAVIEPYPQFSSRPASEGETDVGHASDAGVALDTDAPSDVGDSSDIGAAHSDIGLLPFIEVKDKKFQTKNSASVRTESTVATTSTAEEKKEDDSPVKKPELSPVSTVGNLRSKWETRESALSREAAQRRQERQNVPSSLSKEHIIRLQDQLGTDILSPEKLMSSGKLQQDPQIVRAESSNQQQRAEECLDQRTSLVSVKERLKTPLSRPDIQARRTASKSEGGAAARHSSVSSILSSLEKKATPSDSRSDNGGDSPAFFAVKLRPTGLSQGVPPSFAASPSASVDHSYTATYQISPAKGGGVLGKGSSTQKAPKALFESQAMRLVRQQHDGAPGVHNIESPSRKSYRSRGENWENSVTDTYNTNSPRSMDKNSAPIEDNEALNEQLVGDGLSRNDSDGIKGSSTRQLTYRERRELELQSQQADEEKRRTQEQPIEPAQRDVAALIKQRIAANKKNSASASYDSSEQHEDISTVRNRLRPTISQCSTDEAQNNEKSTSPTRHADHDVKPILPAPRGQLNSGDYDSFDGHDSAYTDRNSHCDEQYLPSGLADEKKANSQSVRSPTSSHQPPRSLHAAHERESEFVVESESPEAEPVPEKAIANAAVSHMLMLQQLQQCQSKNTQLGSSPKTEKESLPPKPLLAVHHSAGNDGFSEEQIGKTPKATMMMLNAFLAGRESISSVDGPGAPMILRTHSEDESSDKVGTGPISPASNHALPALKDDPKYARFFKMLSIGMPMEVVKHAMVRDGFDTTVMDGDHNKPVGIPLKDDPEYAKYFRMLKIGLPMEAVKHAMERDGLDSAVMDQDHDFPVATKKDSASDEPKEKDSHRRARLHWKTLRKVTSNSLWAKIGQDDEINIEIDEQEFMELFQAERTEPTASGPNMAASQKRGSTVCVIDPKRANNGGIILARLKMSHDDMANAVDRIDEQDLTAEQIENVIEYLPTKDERKALEAYMLEGGQDAAEKFDGLCECEKFMVSMMTVKHAKQKVSALLFKLQFESCIQDIQKEACAIEKACEELSNSVRLRQLLGIVLTFGNRLNTAGNGKRKAGAFTLDSLLKLNQAKAFDKKTTFLHYIILIVQRNNELLLNFKDDLPTVFASDKIFWDQCVADLEEVENQLENVRKISLYQAHQAQSYRLRRKTKREDPDESLSDAEEDLTLEEEVEALRSTPIGLFTLSAIKYVSSLRDKVESTKEMYARVLEYFGEEEKQMQPHELFHIIVSFSRDFDKAKEQVFAKEKLKQREERKRLGNSHAGRTPARIDGRPPTFSPAQSAKNSVASLKASNFQPSMGSVLQNLKSSPVPLKSVSLNEDSASSQGNQQSNPDDSADVMDLTYVSDQAYLLAPQQRTSPQKLSSESPSLTRHRVAMVEITPKLQDYGGASFHAEQRRDLDQASVLTEHGREESQQTFHAEEPREKEPFHAEQRREGAQPTQQASVGSAQTTTMMAMRAKARMRRQRPGRPSASPTNLSSRPVTDSAPAVRYSSPARSDNASLHQQRKQQPKPKSPARSDAGATMIVRNLPRTAPAPEDSVGAAPLSAPRSNSRMKRRIEQRNRARRSLDAGMR